jgi:hypothetical protein
MDFNEGEGRGGEEKLLIIYMFGSKEMRGWILITNVFGLRGEGRNDKTKLLFYPYNFIVRIIYLGNREWNLCNVVFLFHFICGTWFIYIYASYEDQRKSSISPSSKWQWHHV